MTKKIYIAGKVSGLPRAETTMKFGSYEKKLMEQGHTPVVPLNFCLHKEAWHTAMRKCLKAMLECDEVHLLHDWNDSPGAQMEREIALKLKIPVKLADS